MVTDIDSGSQRRRIDLNLVRVFVAVFETRSVTLAARRLCVAQPTVSYGLAALRRTLQDTLFVRTKEGMIPTVHAEQIYLEFTAALMRVDNAVEESRHFAPASSHRRFVLAMSDIGEMVFLPPIMERIHKQAPNVGVEVVEATIPDLGRRLATGEVNAAIGNLPGLLADTVTQDLFEERYVCLLRKKHSFIGRKLSLEEFKEANHVLVASSFSGHNQVEELLQKRHGIQRKIALRLPHFAVLARLIATSDLLVTLPSGAAKLLTSYEDLRALELPVAVPTFQVRLHWHERSSDNPANKWLRGIVFDALSRVDS